MHSSPASAGIGKGNNVSSRGGSTLIHVVLYHCIMV